MGCCRALSAEHDVGHVRRPSIEDEGARNFGDVDEILQAPEVLQDSVDTLCGKT